MSSIEARQRFASHRLSCFSNPRSLPIGGRGWIRTIQRRLSAANKRTICHGSTLPGIAGTKREKCSRRGAKALRERPTYLFCLAPLHLGVKSFRTWICAAHQNRNVVLQRSTDFFICVSTVPNGGLKSLLRMQAFTSMYCGGRMPFERCYSEAARFILPWRRRAQGA
jgi:hypothetical protein